MGTDDFKSDLEFSDEELSELEQSRENRSSRSSGQPRRKSHHKGLRVPADVVPRREVSEPEQFPKELPPRKASSRTLPLGVPITPMVPLTPTQTPTMPPLPVAAPPKVEPAAPPPEDTDRIHTKDVEQATPGATPLSGWEPEDAPTEPYLSPTSSPIQPTISEEIPISIVEPSEPAAPPPESTSARTPESPKEPLEEDEALDQAFSDLEEPVPAADQPVGQDLKQPADEPPPKEAPAEREPSLPGVPPPAPMASEDKSQQEPALEKEPVEAKTPEGTAESEGGQDAQHDEAPPARDDEPAPKPTDDLSMDPGNSVHEVSAPEMPTPQEVDPDEEGGSDEEGDTVEIPPQVVRKAVHEAIKVASEAVTSNKPTLSDTSFDVEDTAMPGAGEALEELSARHNPKVEGEQEGERENRVAILLSALQNPAEQAQAVDAADPADLAKQADPDAGPMTERPTVPIKPLTPKPAVTPTSEPADDEYDGVETLPITPFPLASDLTVPPEQADGRRRSADTGELEELSGEDLEELGADSAPPPIPESAPLSPFETDASGDQAVVRIPVRTDDGAADEGDIMTSAMPDEVDTPAPTGQPPKAVQPPVPEDGVELPPTAVSSEAPSKAPAGAPAPESRESSIPDVGGAPPPAPVADDAVPPPAPVADDAMPPPAPVADDAAPPPAPVADDAAPPPAPVADDAAPPPAPVADDAAPPSAPVADDAAPPPAPVADDALPSVVIDDTPATDDGAPPTPPAPAPTPEQTPQAAAPPAAAPPAAPGQVPTPAPAAVEPAPADQAPAPPQAPGPEGAPGGRLALTRGRKRKKAWFEEIFDEDWLRTLKPTNSTRTALEVDFLEESLQPSNSSEMLDLGCGSGRHTIELAGRGYDVTGYDLSLPLLIRAADEAQRRNLKVNFVHGDFRELSFEEQFDAIYCLSTTFGYFDDDSNRKMIHAVNAALRVGGRFLLDVVNRDYAIRDLPARIWWEGEGSVVLEEVDFNYFTSRIISKRSVVFEDGRHLEQEFSVRSYSLHELGKILHHAGFRVLEVSGHIAHRARFFGNHSRTLVLLAEKRSS